MKTNKTYYSISKDNKEDFLDIFYMKDDQLIIPLSNDKENKLTENNHILIKLITAFDTNVNVLKQSVSNQNEIIDKITEILNNTENINFCAFSQFFMVYNLNYSVYKNLNNEDKKEFISLMLSEYCSKRHNIYLNHGYSDTVLQVMSDNYSHKRNSKSGIEKIISFLPDLTHIKSSENFLINNNYFFLPDKGDKKLFKQLLIQLNIKMESSKKEQNKTPDIVFKNNDNYYICELKTMKEGGGGQDKQMRELIDFINYSEQNKNIHYISFLDGIYSNILFHYDTPKIKKQREDIENALQNNPNNYFVNTYGIKKLINDIFQN